MVSTWTEFLRLSKTEANTALLEICMYEGLGLLEEPEDENAEPILPKTIDGKEVVGVDDGYMIYGGELQCYDQENRFSYGQADVEKAVNWLQAHHWKITDDLIDELRKAVAD